jgi:hypothetical protein
MKSLFISIFCLLVISSHAQDSGNNPSSEGFEAKMITTDRMSMEYMDFGGEGPVLIHLQGVHNAAAQKNDFNYNQNYVAWRDNLTKASAHYRVYSPIYRGYGNSDKDGDDQYKVENIAKDILAFMEAMKIDKATFIGRTTAPQVMFYLAENYPDKVEAMVVSDNSIYKTLPIGNDEIKEFMYYCSYAAMDLGDRAPDVVMPSYDYEPNFYSDATKKINIPLYWPYSEQMNIVMMNLSLMEYLQPNNAFIPNQKAKTYFDKLYADKELQNRIKQYYAENNPTQKNMEALKNAFGNYLTLQNMDDIEGANLMEKFKKSDELMMSYLVSLKK